MGIPLEFECTPEIEEFVREIAASMALYFNLSLAEATGRINQAWRGQRMLTEADEFSLFHNEPDYWAKTLYYGPGVPWWLGEEGLAPVPYTGVT